MDNSSRNSAPQSSRARRNGKWRPVTAALLSGALLLGSASGALAQKAAPDRPQGDQRSSAGRHAQARHLDWRLKRALSRINASEEQQKRILDIMRQARNDLGALREKRFAARKAIVELLSKPTIDRAAIETQRVEQMRLADAGSTLLTKALADAAEVLTPEQRVAFVKRMQQLRHRYGHDRGLRR
jgi:protein CpxP